MELAGRRRECPKGCQPAGRQCWSPAQSGPSEGRSVWMQICPDQSQTGRVLEVKNGPENENPSSVRKPTIDRFAR